jgi:serine protease AprX
VSENIGSGRRKTAGLAAAAVLAGVALMPVASGQSAALAATAPAPAPATAPATAPAASSPFATSLWDATPTPTTLAMVRSIIGADTGTAASLTGAGVGIAMIDTGVAPVAGLPAARIVNGPDLSVESQSSTLRYLDTYGHGTHLAGIMVGNDPSTGTKGIAPGAKLTSVKVGTSNGAVDATQMLAAIDWVVQHRNDDPANPIKVLNLSYGTRSSLQANDPLMFAVEKAWASGIVVVASAGNDGDPFFLSNPAADSYVISVGASNSYGTVSRFDDDIATYTNVSAVRRVDVLAPGQSILSLRDPGAVADVNYPSARVGSTLFRGSGTSQSAAVVSAAVALMLQNNKTLTPDQVKAKLVNGTTAFTPFTGASILGLYALNVNNALTASGAGTQSWGRSNGTGSIEHTRGILHLVRDALGVTGENSLFGPFSTSAWAAKAGTGTAWVGGVWMGKRMAADGWTGTSWASRTWGSATWGTSYWGSTNWQDPGWAARYWSGGAWAGGSWSARYWSSDGWSTAHWG